MFFPGSRYEKAGTYTVTRPDGKTIKATKPALPMPSRPQGFHRRLEGQRLDMLAAHYLADPTAFWRLCDANNAVVPDELAARDVVGIPAKGS
ncbi:MAG: hypothetical protein Q7T82_08115 [Armatimonadota bacterium]|nr:hypothetical protein [Armatimonadota bacterium]